MIRSRPSTDTYRENWDRIFGKAMEERGWYRHPTKDAYSNVPFTESYDSHPAAD